MASLARLDRGPVCIWCPLEAHVDRRIAGVKGFPVYGSIDASAGQQALTPRPKVFAILAVHLHVQVHVRANRRYDRNSGRHVFVGYEASHRLRLELPFDKELLNAVLTRVASSASEATVTISFDVSDVESLRREAMRAAVADAREGARFLAEASGATLGEILRIDYSYVEIRTRRLTYEYASTSAMYDAASPAPDVEPEALDAEEGVTVVWEIS